VKSRFSVPAFSEIIIIISIEPFVGPWPLFQFLDAANSRWGSFEGENPDLVFLHLVK
jgi:hypothetical protein